MYLKRIHLHGFKSFAEKSIFDFKEGVTCITGPNGCGKSNVVDAIKWTLGEQRAKSLRGKEMADIIFGGNQARRPADYAEVSLVFGNAGHLNDGDDELVIGRRLSRSGESVYMVNRQPSRLKDIKEIFMDTGIGVGGYYVMEQGKIDYILNAGVKERRTIFEEASGISKFKSQKKEALNKLKRTEANLNRLQDLLGELESRLKGVRIQAGKAQKYQEYSDEIKKLKMAQAVAQFRTYRERNDSLADKIVQTQEEIKNLGNQSQDFQKDLEEVAAERDQLESMISKYRDETLTLTEKCTHLTQNLEDYQSRLEELSMDSERSKEEEKRNQLRIEHLNQELVDLAEEWEQQTIEKEEWEGDLAEKEEKMRSFHSSTSESREELDGKKAELVKLLHQRSETQNELASLTSKIQGLEASRSRLEERIQDSLRREREILYNRDEAESELENLKEELEFLQQEQEFLAGQIEEKSGREEELGRGLSEKTERLARIDSRMEALSQFSMEEVDEGVKIVLEGRDNGTFKGIHDALVQLFTVDLKYAPAVEAALGPFIHAVVVDDEDTAQEAAKRLAGLDSGSALFLPVDGSYYDPKTKGKLPMDSLNPQDIIQAKSPYDTLIKRLLSRVAVVKDLKTAFKLRGDYPYFDWVTLTGDICYKNGAVKAGAPKSGNSTLAQRSELLQLEEEAKALKSEVNEHQDDLSALRVQLREHRENIQKSREEYNKKSIEIVQVNASLKQYKEQLEEQKTIQEHCNREWDETSDEHSRFTNEKTSREELLAQVEKDYEKTEKAVEKIESNLAGVEEKEKDLQEDITTLKVKIASYSQQIDSIQATRERLQEELDEREGRKNSFGRESESLEGRRENLRGKIADSEEMLDTSRDRLEYLEGELEEFEGELRGLLDREDNIKSSGEKSFRRFNSLTEDLSSLKVQKSKLEVRLEDLIEKVKESMEVDLEEFSGKYEEGEEIELEQVDQRVQELNQKLRRLGQVNFEALRELQELEERFGYLKEQEQDLVKSRDSLHEIIQKIDTVSRERFSETFEQIRSHFQALFRKLFGGGKADIVLEEGEDILEAGIDIIAKPPGKEPRSITLLSGGEKTMTTVALSFSIFQTKPSPFCLLDEVDAALDETNIDRFIRMLNEFMDTCQFIIISHRRQTISSADVIYGVTMQESGVSKNISLELKQIEQDVELAS